MRRPDPFAADPVRRAVYFIADVDFAATRDLDLVAVTKAALAGGAGVIQLRAKPLDGQPFLGLARRLIGPVKAAGALFIVNDRIDVALACGADGVHIGQTDICPTDARALIGPDMLLGLSITSDAQIAAVDPGQVDYVGIGPIFPTGSKANASAALGCAELARIRRISPVPAVAIGGIAVENVATVAATGVAGVAVIGAIAGSADPAQATRSLAAAFAAGMN